MVISLTQPGVQGISDPMQAQSMAMQYNNLLASLIANNTMRFGAFAALPMADPAAAAAELKRAVQDLGFLGGMVNDYQVTGPVDNRKFIYSLAVNHVSL
jgi:2,3-dihydroxybenzoate decarboxylase